MPQCVKCGKKVKIFYGIWEHKEPFSEFYNKPLCNSCHGELQRIKTATEAATKREIETLCERLLRMGLDATVESKERSRPLRIGWASNIIDSVKVENRNIDLVELEEHYLTGRRALMASEDAPPRYRCNYTVLVRAEGFDDRLKGELKVARKSFWKVNSEVVDFWWKGKKIAQILNNDITLKGILHRLKDNSFLPLEIKPFHNRKVQCVRIRQKHGSHFPADAFPTNETFEAADRIAQHIRSIANIPL